MKRVVARLFRATLLAFFGAVAAIDAGDTFAVIASGGCAHWDAKTNESAYWYGLYLAYDALITRGLGHDQITVLYCEGEDFESKYPCFQNVWACENGGSITDKPMDADTLAQVLDSLSAVLDSEDTLIVWWAAGHGYDRYYEGTWICDTHYFAQYEGGVLYDTTFSRLLDQVESFAVRIVLWSTCNSGGLVDDLTDTDSNSTVGLAAVQFNHMHASVEDTLLGVYSPPDSGDTVNLPGLTMFAAYAMNRHGIRGEQCDADEDADSKIQLSEIRQLADSMYLRNPYLLQDNYDGLRICPLGGGNEPYDTTVLFDPDGIASSVALAEVPEPGGLLLEHNGVTKARMTAGGYLQLAGLAAAGTANGLFIGPNVSLETDGDMIYGDSLLPNRPLWLAIPDSVQGGLLIRQQCDSVVFHVATDDTVRIRAWLVEQHPELQ